MRGEENTDKECALIRDYFQSVSAAGAFVEGASDQSLKSLRVVR